MYVKAKVNLPFNAPLQDEDLCLPRGYTVLLWWLCIGSQPMASEGPRPSKNLPGGCQQRGSQYLLWQVPNNPDSILKPYWTCWTKSLQISVECTDPNRSAFIAFCSRSSDVFFCKGSTLSPCIALSVSMTQSKTWTLTSSRSLGKEVLRQQWPQVY